MSTDLEHVQPVGLLNIQTGELLEPTIDNAAAALQACRTMKEHVNDIVAETTAYLAAEAETRGTKTLHGEHATLVLQGGVSDEYDPHDLMDLLRSAGCPEDRIEQAVVAEITYKVNRSVLKQLAGANQDYRAAIDLAKREVERPFRASVKTRREA